MTYRIKNWGKFQHFKDRRPPWVKLYRDLLDDPDWHDLSPKLSKTLIMLWLIASEDNEKAGTLPDLRKIAFRMRVSEDEIKIQLNQLYQWVLRDDIDAISDRYQLDAPETETETETETELVVDGLDMDAWNRWEQYRKKIKKPIKRVSIQAAQKKLAGFGSDQSQVVEQSIANGYQGLFELKGAGNGKNGSGGRSGSSVANTIRELTGQNRTTARVID